MFLKGEDAEETGVEGASDLETEWGSRWGFLSQRGQAALRLCHFCLTAQETLSPLQVA